MPYHGVAWNATEVKITCQVECYPICEIYWLKNGVPINFQEHFFTIKNTKLRPEPAKNDFESIVSTLAWNMTAWPNGKLNRAVDNDNYTCQSSPNEHGAGVYSTTHFRVECKDHSLWIHTFSLLIFFPFNILLGEIKRERKKRKH